MIPENPPKSETLVLVKKIDLVDKKSPENLKFIFRFFSFQSDQKKILDTLRAPQFRTRPV